MTDRDSITRTRAKTPGAEDYPTSMAVHWRATVPTQSGIIVCHAMHEGWTQTEREAAHTGSRLKPMTVSGRPRLTGQPSSRTGENPPYGMIGGIEETSASFEARSAPRSYPTAGGARKRASLPRTLFRSRHRALRLVDVEPQLVGQEPAHRGHDAFAGAAAANIDVAVVGVPAKAVTASGQFSVEVVKHEIAKDGRKRAALRRPLIHRTDQTVFHHPGVEKRPDEFEHTLIGHSRGDAR